ncbi:hypothetical protein KFE26_23075 [Shewanella sp. M16]|uniref:hypothetical protein n=1 Tax=Shewanella sp. M16 TaxID=2830837 RepID=UPI001BB014AB|nr:hypothetical protein [Shewanella sp. M16]MBS0045134.1 hypothetical protein [Shewanella sp. M16]
MFNDIEKAEMLINEMDNRYFIVIPFELKDSLKAAVSSVQFNLLALKEWSVSLRTKHDLTLWIAANYDPIVKANLIRAKRELAAGELVLVNDAFNVKEHIKLKFNAIFGEHGEQKGWFVRPEFLESALNLRDQKNLELKTLKEKPQASDPHNLKLTKLEKVIESFLVVKEDPTVIMGGLSASYIADNADIKQLINKASVIISNNVRLKLQDQSIDTFNDEYKLIIRDISSKYSSFNAIETIVYLILVNVFNNAKNSVTPSLTSFKSESDLTALVKDFFKIF